MSMALITKVTWWVVDQESLCCTSRNPMSATNIRPTAESMSSVDTNASHTTSYDFRTLIKCYIRRSNVSRVKKSSIAWTFNDRIDAKGKRNVSLLIAHYILCTYSSVKMLTGSNG